MTEEPSIIMGFRRGLAMRSVTEIDGRQRGPPIWLPLIEAVPDLPRHAGGIT